MPRLNDRLFHNLLRGIVAARGPKGATIGEMRADYEYVLCESWPIHALPEETAYLDSIFGLSSVTTETGAIIYYINIKPKCQPNLGMYFILYIADIDLKLFVHILVYLI